MLSAHMSVADGQLDHLQALIFTFCDNCSYESTLPALGVRQKRNSS